MNFYSEKGIPEKVERKWYDIIPGIYQKRQREHREKIGSIQWGYKVLERMVNETNQFLEAQLTTSGKYRIEKVKMPGIDFSNLDAATQQINAQIRLIKSDQFQSKIKAEAGRLKALEREEFLYGLINNMPNDKKCIEITTYAHPFAPDPDWDKIYAFYSDPGKDVIQKKFMGETIFFLFCPEEHSEEELSKIIARWDGKISTAVTQYVCSRTKVY